jgi:hypothetical protein
MKNSKSILMISVIVLIIGAFLVSSYYMFLQAGKDDPRALDSEVLLNIVRQEANIDRVLIETNRPCLPIELTRPSPEKMGIEGITYAKRPGQYEINLLLNTDYEKQAKRDRQLKQLDFLAEHGLFTASSGVIDTSDGKREVRRYRLTWKGALEVGKRGGVVSLCLSYGRKAFGKIIKVEDLKEKHALGDIYSISYSLNQEEVPGWASDPSALNLFDGLALALKQIVRVTKVVRTSDGWKLLNKREPKRSVSAFANLTMPIDVDKLKNKETAPSVNELNSYIENNIRGMGFLMRGMNLCLPFTIQPGDEKSSNDSNELFVTYYDKRERNKYELNKIVNSLHILAAFERSGLAEMKYIEQASGKNKSTSDSIVSSYGAGVKFRINQEAIEALNLSKRGRGCIPYGRVKLEILSVTEQIGLNGVSHVVTARKTVEEVPKWLNKMVDHLPMLESVVKHGVMVKGTLIGREYGGVKHWDVLSPKEFHPKIKHTALPGYVEPIMPNTANAIELKTVKAPLVTANNNDSEYVPPKLHNKKLAGHSFSLKQIPVQRKISKSSEGAQQDKVALLRKPPYPVKHRDLHVVSIQRSDGKQGGARGRGKDIVGQANINANISDSVLILHAQYKTIWNLNEDSKGQISKIIITGSPDQEVRLSGNQKPEIVSISWNDLFKKLELPRYIRFPTGEHKNNLNDLAKIAVAITGREPSTYQAAEKVPRGGFFISKSTPKFRVPMPIKPNDYPPESKLQIQSEWKDYWPEQEFSSGKLYTEATIQVKDGVSAGKVSNIGLCRSRDDVVEDNNDVTTKAMILGEQSIRQDGDLFGLAADLDNQRLYYHVNGEWMTGKPGSGDGIKLNKNTYYRVCASGQIRPGKGVRAKTDWDFEIKSNLLNQEILPGYRVM